MLNYAKKFGIALILLIPILASLWIVPYACPSVMLMCNMVNGNTVYIFCLFILATAIEFGIGYDFFIGAYKSVKHGSANMDVLVVLGTSSAWLYGVILLFIGHQLNVTLLLQQDSMDAMMSMGMTNDM